MMSESIFANQSAASILPTYRFMIAGGERRTFDWKTTRTGHSLCASARYSSVPSSEPSSWMCSSRTRLQSVCSRRFANVFSVNSRRFHAR